MIVRPEEWNSPNQCQWLTEPSMRTGRGIDDVSIRDVEVSFELGVATGGGPDKVALGPNVVAEEILAIDTGAGNDTVALGLGVASGIDLQVRTRGGADSVYTLAASPLGIFGVSAIRNITINGGLGIRDKITIAPDSLSASRVILLGFAGKF